MTSSRATGARIERLTATKFDDSADVHSIGAGVFDATAHDPADPYSGNIPYEIAGIPVPDAVSFYYLSQYSLRDPQNHHLATCGDMRAGCADGPRADVPSGQDPPPSNGNGQQQGAPAPAAGGGTDRAVSKPAKCKSKKKKRGCRKKR